METLDSLRKLFAYDDWANHEVLASLRAAGTPPERAVAVLGHVLGAHDIWLSRLRRGQGQPTGWPELDLDGLATRLTESAARWREYVDGLRPEDLGRPWSYTNPKGETFTYPLGDVLMHVVIHGAYHRGQAALLLRAAGYEPISTDYTRALRQGAMR